MCLCDSELCVPPQYKESDSAERAVNSLNNFTILDKAIKVTLVTDNPMAQYTSGAAMELLDSDEYQGGVGLTLQSRVSLMAKLAETHNVGELCVCVCRILSMRVKFPPEL